MIESKMGMGIVQINVVHIDVSEGVFDIHTSLHSWGQNYKDQSNQFGEPDVYMVMEAFLSYFFLFFAHLKRCSLHCMVSNLQFIK